MGYFKDNRKVFILLNITHDCNMRCKYCYYQQEMNEKPGKMSYEVLEAAIKRAAESSFEKLMFTAHGGEPLTRGMGFFTDMLDMQKKHLEGRSYSNFVQTNGTLLTREFISLFNENDFGVSLSLDGPASMQDKYRVYSNDRGTFDDIMKNIGIMEEIGLRFAALSVCSNDTVKNMLSYYDLFKEFKNFDGMDLVCPQIQYTPDMITTGYYGKGLIELFDRWFYDTECMFEIRVLSSFVFSILLSRPRMCFFVNNCFSNYVMVSVEPDGSVSPCDSNPEIKIGNILDDSLESLIFKNPIKKMYSVGEQKRLEDCLFCEWYSCCNGGCPSLLDNNGKQLYCEDYKMVLSHIKNTLEKVGVCREEILGEESFKNIPNPCLRMQLKKIYKEIQGDSPDACNLEVKNPA
ncbi:radical SAM protein with 4Fe4S-binding SPASM domain [Anaerobacterium chartisolvens]|uniref:Radical SAM protein with 4Fe4S-binding SPASM domain n=1 Tax=Anaerobacterium chartisolvens TaxID=1297424 RepID=A0A369AG23_9FIRM|nr:radical SAM protein [Anaerobacterium chartisolvens]RCX08300.1 radical SAM protein with 4Fe4S-binding SPASM domain [Anaerobacterium chartisolvens]